MLTVVTIGQRGYRRRQGRLLRHGGPSWRGRSDHQRCNRCREPRRLHQQPPVDDRGARKMKLS